MNKKIENITENIIHVAYTPGEIIGSDVIFEDALQSFSYNNKEVIKEKIIQFTPKDVFKFIVDGEPVIKKKKTANGEVSYIENAREEFERKSYSAVLEFTIGDNEKILGMGQYEDGFMDYRNRKEYLYESNMRIAIPFFVTTANYGVLIDSESNMIFTSKDNTIRFELDSVKEISYYVFLGDNISELINEYQYITGRASMLPKWVFGYIQSKERYNSQDEILEIMDQFREREIPLDCIVQDWYSWDEGLWGEKYFNKKRYPNLKNMIDTLHDNEVHFMVSVWPNMSPESENYREFKESGWLLPNSNLYDVFNEEARQLYFEQCQREILDSGSDALWCDNAEPFSDADWNGETKRPEEDRYNLVVSDSKKSMEWERLNGYGLAHAKGIYENWRKSYPEKRVVNLTRSGYSSCQKYGTILWSGDITAKWSTMKKQIAEGVKMGYSGMPYWTLDIGGFFVVKDKYENRGCNSTSTEPLWFWDGDYNDGILDPEYCELYTRWIQFGTFLPIFRSHGTDTPREPWQFKDEYCEIITRYIKLRYKLMPYIYSLAYKAHSESYIIMRGFAFDFAYDEKSLDTIDEYMFGPSILVAPVTSKSSSLDEKGSNDSLAEVPQNRKVYLPKGCKWYDFWNNNVYEGGNEYEILAPIETIPVFVKEGSIIPMSKDQMYANENKGDVEEVRVYAGADGCFALYNDSGDGYDFEKGQMSIINMEYSDKNRELIIHENEGDFESVKIERICYIQPDGSVKKYPADYCGKRIRIKL